MGFGLRACLYEKKVDTGSLSDLVTNIIDIIRGAGHPGVPGYER
jgi:hypothetical protein